MHCAPRHTLKYNNNINNNNNNNNINNNKNINNNNNINHNNNINNNNNNNNNNNDIKIWFAKVQLRKITLNVPKKALYNSPMILEPLKLTTVNNCFQV